MVQHDTIEKTRFIVQFMVRYIWKQPVIGSSPDFESEFGRNQWMLKNNLSSPPPRGPPLPKISTN